MVAVAARLDEPRDLGGERTEHGARSVGALFASSSCKTSRLE
mgnify:CR=1 FL=1